MSLTDNFSKFLITNQKLTLPASVRGFNLKSHQQLKKKILSTKKCVRFTLGGVLQEPPPPTVLLLAVSVAKNRPMSKNNFLSNFDEIQNLKSLWLRDFKFWLSSKSETKFFFDREDMFFIFWKIQRPGSSKSKKFLSPILMKLKIWNPYGLGISHMKFERNRSRKFFWRPTNLGA